MTVILGVATPNAAILAADTRLNVTFKDTQKGIHDDKELTITYPDGKKMVVGKRFRKIRSLPYGWIAGAGAFPLIHKCLLEAEEIGCADINKLHKRLRAVYDREAAAIFEQFSGLGDQLGKTTMFSNCVAGRRFALHTLPLSGGAPTSSDYVFSAPGDLAGATVKQIDERLKEELESPADLAAVYAQVRLVAEILHDVHGASALVSDITELGLMINTGDRAIRLYLHKSNSDIIESSDNQLQGWFQNF